MNALRDIESSFILEVIRITETDKNLRVYYNPPNGSIWAAKFNIANPGNTEGLCFYYGSFLKEPSQVPTAPIADEL
jgi:hypothetical protein